MPQLTPRSVGRRVGFALLYGLYLLAFLAAVHYVFFWRPYVKAHRHLKGGDHPQSYVDPAAWRQLGSVWPDKHSSFVRFPKRKPPGVTRVCAFGDSFTHGEEVDNTHDFPTLLQQLFDQRGPAHVEVLNFGNGWYGFHQAYLMWDLVGRHFSCDYVLLGPSCFQSDRDVTFNHTNLFEPFYLHARFILDGDDVRLIPVLGNTLLERFDEYFRFVPHWQYLRYDSNAPPVVRAALPRDRTVANPFYYYPGTMDEEALATYRILLRKLAQGGSQIVLLHWRDAIVALADRVQMPNVTGAQGFRQQSFPYVAPKGHCSAWGYHLVAEQFYAHLTGQTHATLTVLRTGDIPRNAAGSAAPDAPAVSSYASIDVRVGDIPVGVFVSARREQTLSGGQGTASSLKHSGAVSLLAIKEPQMSLLNAVFLPLDFALQPDMEVVASSGPDAADRHPLARVQRLDAAVNIGVADIDGFGIDRQKRLTLRDHRHLSTGSRRVTILVGDHPVLKGSGDAEGLVLSPVNGDIQLIRAGEFGFAMPDTLPASGDINLVLEDARHGVTRVPIARWMKTEVEIAPLGRPLQIPLSAAVAPQ